RKDADNATRVAVHSNILADDRRISSELSPPESVREDDASVLSRFAFLRQERPAQVGSSPKEREERRGHRDGGHALRTLRESERGIPPHVQRLGLEDRGLAESI